MRFRLTTVAYVFAILATGMAAFGGGGIVAALLVMLFWEWAKRGKATLTELLVATAIFGVLIGLLLPAGVESRESSRAERCMANLKAVAAALLQYKEDHGRLPTAVARSTPSSKDVCWRTAILSYLDERRLFQQYAGEEPWDGRKNSTVSSQGIDVYCCPSDPSLTMVSAQTNYFAIVDRRTAWMAGPRFTDDPDQTLMLIECASLNVPWAKPKDLTFAQAMEILTAPSYPQIVHVYSNRPGYFYSGSGERREGVNVAFASGRVAYLPLPISRDLATALLTANGGEAISSRYLDLLTRPQLDYGKIYATVVFIVLSLVPAMKSAWRRQKQPRSYAPPGQRV